MRIPRAVPVLAAVLSLGLLAGCSDTKGAADATGSDAVAAGLLTQDTAVSSVAAAMSEAGSAHVKLSATVLGQDLVVEGDQQIGATPDDSQLALTATVLGMDIELRMIDQVVYANLGELSQNKFAAIDLTDTSDPVVAQFSALANGADVSAQIQDLRDAITGFDQSGESQTIDGVETQPYVVTIDTSKLPQHEGVPAAAGTAEITIFVGSDDLPRRMTTDATGQVVTLDLTQWGEPVEVVAPTADQISEQGLGELLSQLPFLSDS